MDVICERLIDKILNKLSNTRYRRIVGRSELEKKTNKELQVMYSEILEHEELIRRENLIRDLEDIGCPYYAYELRKFTDEELQRLYAQYVNKTANF